MFVAVFVYLSVFFVFSSNFVLQTTILLSQLVDWWWWWWKQSLRRPSGNDTKQAHTNAQLCVLPIPIFRLIPVVSLFELCLRVCLLLLSVADLRLNLKKSAFSIYCIFFSFCCFFCKCSGFSSLKKTWSLFKRWLFFMLKPLNSFYFLFLLFFVSFFASKQNKFTKTNPNIKTNKVLCILFYAVLTGATNDRQTATRQMF